MTICSIENYEKHSENISVDAFLVQRNGGQFYGQIAFKQMEGKIWIQIQCVICVIWQV